MWFGEGSHHPQNWYEWLIVPKMFVQPVWIMLDTCFPPGSLEFWYMLGRKCLHDQSPNKALGSNVLAPCAFSICCLVLYHFTVINLSCEHNYMLNIVLLVNHQTLGEGGLEDPYLSWCQKWDLLAQLWLTEIWQKQLEEGKGEGVRDNTSLVLTMLAIESFTGWNSSIFWEVEVTCGIWKW